MSEGAFLGGSFLGGVVADGSTTSAASRPPGNTLGCGSYEVYAQTRGGGSLVDVVPWTSLTWELVLDDTGQATVTLDLADPLCCALLSVLRPWRHEIALYRDGIELWVGPIYSIVQPAEQRQINARDLTAWWDRRRIHQDHAYQDADISRIFEEVSADAMAPDNSPGLTATATPCGVTATLQYLASQHLMAGPVLRDLARVGVDWTTIRRSVLVGGTAVPAAPIGTLADQHFLDPPQATLDGSAQRNALGVRGNGGGTAGDTIYGDYQDPDAIALDGLLEDVVTVSTIEDNISARAAARTRVALQKEIVLVDQCVLAPTAPIGVQDLVPGAVTTLMLEETCIPVAGPYRLQKVAGSISASDAIERITLTVQPLGTE